MRPPAPVGGPTQTSMCFLLTYRALDCLTHTCFMYVNFRRTSARTWRKLTQRPGTVATRHGRVVVVPFSLGRLDPCTSYRPRCSTSLLFLIYLPTFTISSTIVPANDLLTEPPTCKGCMVVGHFHRSPMPLQRPLVVHVGQCCTIGAGCPDIAYRTEATRETAHS